MLSMSELIPFIKCIFSIPDDEPCDSDPCLNNGRCRNIGYGNNREYTCVCEDGYTGNRCQGN